MFEGHPDDLWDGHDWDVWWAWLTPQERDQLLDLAWGEEPAPLLGQKLTMLRGATYEVVEKTVTRTGMHTTITRNVATDELHVYLEEKRAGRDR
jgi:hypothetical protein